MLQHYAEYTDAPARLASATEDLATSKDVAARQTTAVIATLLRVAVVLDSRFCITALLL